ncbi:Diadenosine tetraphosphate (Ap4A) hydrolase [Ferrithrix thermotolerans DSM 19514]|uniref:Diadenosine tetraphosphate (Ap4A) hydrolase n=1 Tax=Ferrithrix thermotolerans DSM 19514 TaxID=1121881 RepID=A0A1M4VM46_9ACTN|nr:HIT domain-containing protein [Ferrithrix thermotolerans]SHE69922.1 Diadenosine tetraphosphate (Ap4A) hydrolase [Ferrithrix thermotolerans DSM 19514]
MTIESIWAGWRMSFIEGSASDRYDRGVCVLCEIAQTTGSDKDLKVIERGRHCYVVMNIYPYTSGHLMVVPYLHSAEVADLGVESRIEIFDLLDRGISTLKGVYSPHGFNVGVNLGRAAGAGIAEHIHFHIVPRWNGDTNFMTTVAGARVQPESLEVSYERITTSWNKGST